MGQPIFCSQDNLFFQILRAIFMSVHHSILTCELVPPMPKEYKIPAVTILIDVKDGIRYFLLCCYNSILSFKPFALGKHNMKMTIQAA